MGDKVTLQQARADSAFTQLLPCVTQMVQIQRADATQDVIEQIAFELYLKQRNLQMQKTNLSPLEELVPTITGNNWDDKSILHAKGKGVGEAKIIANPTDDLPRIDIKEDAYAQKIYDVGDSYGFKIVNGGNAVEVSNKATIAKEAIERKLRRIGIFGDKQHDLFGIFNTPHAKVWKSEQTISKAKLLSALNSIVRKFSIESGYQYTPNALVLPSALFELLADEYKANNETISLLETFEKSNPGLKVVPDAASELGDGAEGMIVLGRFEASLFRNNIVAGFRQLAPQYRNLESVVNCVARTAGVEVIDARALQRVKFKVTA